MLFLTIPFITSIVLISPLMAVWNLPIISDFVSRGAFKHAGGYLYQSGLFFYGMAYGRFPNVAVFVSVRFYFVARMPSGQWEPPLIAFVIIDLVFSLDSHVYDEA